PCREAAGPARVLAPLDLPEDLALTLTATAGEESVAPRTLSVRVNGREAGTLAVAPARTEARPAPPPRAGRGAGPPRGPPAGGGAGPARRGVAAGAQRRGRRAGGWRRLRGRVRVLPRGRRAADAGVGSGTVNGGRAIVIGGGPAGLKAAHELAKAGAEVTLLE